MSILSGYSVTKNRLQRFRFREIGRQCHVTSVPHHSSHSSANSVIRSTAFLEHLVFLALFLQDMQTKNERKKEKKKRKKDKDAPSPWLFWRLPDLSFSFSAELDQLWASVEEDPSCEQPYSHQLLAGVTLLR